MDELASKSSTTSSPSTIHQAPTVRGWDVSFTSDKGSLRFREAYRRRRKATAQKPNNDNALMTIIPDAIAWRIYAKAIAHVVQLQQQNSTTCHWLFVESVAHNMDRDTGPAAPGERGLLTKLLRNDSSTVSVMLDYTCIIQDWDNNYPYSNSLDSSNVEDTLATAARHWHETHHTTTTDIFLWRAARDTMGEPDNKPPPLPEAHLHWTFTSEILNLICQGLSADVQADVTRRFERCLADHIERRRQRVISHETVSPSPVPTSDADNAIYQGRYMVSTDNPTEAYVRIHLPQGSGSAGTTHWFISQSNSAVQAIDQDTVAIQPLEETQWEQPVGRRRLVVSTNNQEDDGDTQNSVENTWSTVPTARLVQVIRPGPRRRVVATLLVNENDPDLWDASALAVPMDPRIPKVRLRNRSDWQKWVGQRLLVQILFEEGSNDSGRYPTGYVLQRLGPVGDLETEIECLLYEHRIPREPWSLASRAQLPNAVDWRITADLIKGRRDLRQSHTIFSVDPVGCQDIDDCMHVRRLPDTGDLEVGVHIADVTHFVPLGSPLDLQARSRGTTFYLVDRRFDMLPSVLSSNLCSLHGGQDRLAVSVIWTIKSDFSKVLTTWYGRTVIHNYAAMTYDQADRILSGQSPEPEGASIPPPLTTGSPVTKDLIPQLKEDLTLLTHIARQRRKDRQDRGAVDLNNTEKDAESGSELKFTIVNGEPVKVQPKKSKEIHRTIEELMIWANTSVASMIQKSFPDSALLRVHRTVEEENFADLRGLLESGKLSMTFHGKTNAELAASLQEAQTSSNKVVASLLRSMATRAMSEALYVSTGSVRTREKLAHYGLGVELYTHFTSPIRRYADVCVHHQLLSALNAARPSNSTSPAKHIREKGVPESLPESSVMSVLTEGVAELLIDEVDLEIDRAIEIADANVEEMTGSIVPPREKRKLFAVPLLAPEHSPFNDSQVAHICENLNDHNRLAKHSSRDCQRLFLSLYFRHHVETTQAVVTDIRENGFFCYIPKFDMRSPIFVRDKGGHVQIDPSFFGLPRSAGADPSLAFTSSTQIRRFSPSESNIAFTENTSLEVFLGDKSYAWRPLDVVTVSITCPDWDNRARVPLPSVQLLHRRSGRSGKSDNVSAQAPTIPPAKPNPSSLDDLEMAYSDDGPFVDSSLFDLIQELPVVFQSDTGTLSAASLEQEIARLNSKTVAGRLSWGGFQNPDTRAAAQSVAQEAAAALRNDRPGHVINEYDANNRMAREVTARQQRLAAEKRNARRARRS